MLVEFGSGEIVRVAASCMNKSIERNKEELGLKAAQNDQNSQHNKANEAPVGPRAQLQKFFYRATSGGVDFEKCVVCGLGAPNPSRSLYACRGYAIAYLSLPTCPSRLVCPAVCPAVCPVVSPAVCPAVSPAGFS